MKNINRWILISDGVNSKYVQINDPLLIAIPPLNPFQLEISQRAIAEAGDYDLLSDEDKIYYEPEYKFRMKLFKLLRLLSIN